jgi:hypothetical protein
MNDVVNWWSEFLRNRSTGRNGGLRSNDGKTIFLFAQYELDRRERQVTGNVTLNPNVERVIGPVINTQAETPDFARSETERATNTTCKITKASGQLIQIPFSQQSGVKAPDYYDGLWFCIPAENLERGDKIEFSADGEDGFQANAEWTVV